MLTIKQQEGKRKELAESFAMRKAERWRAKAVAKVRTFPCPPPARVASFSIPHFSPLLQVMESQGQVPLQGGGGGPWGGGADDEFAPLLQVMCRVSCVTRHM